MNIPSLILYTVTHVRVMIQVIAQLQEFDIPHIDPLLFDRPKFQDHMIFLVADIFIIQQK